MLVLEYVFVFEFVFVCETQYSYVYIHTQAKSQQDWHAADRMGPGWPRGEQ